MKRPTITLTIGMSSSGKTTWAEEYVRNRGNCCNFNRDDYRFGAFCNGKRDWSCYKFNRKNEELITEIIETHVLLASKKRDDIIISDTNLNPKTRLKWVNWANENGYEYVEKEFPIEWDEARKRNLQRVGGISESVLWSQYLKMNTFLGRKVYTPDTSKNKAVIIDIDGTVAKVNGRGFYDWDKVSTDIPRKLIISMIHGLIEDDYTPIFLSGRDGSCKEDTYNWIMENIMQWYLPAFGGFELFMRPVGNREKDKKVKEDLFWKYIANRYNVQAAVDDRASVLQLWRELGIPNIIDVSGDRYNEF